MVVTEDGDGSKGGAAGFVAPVSSDDSIAVGGIVAIAVAAVALVVFLLLMLFVRRRNKEDDSVIKHVYLDDGSHLLTDMDSNDAGSPQKQRVAHVVGEDDSVQSGWTGYTPEFGPAGRRSGGDILADLDDLEHERGFEMGLDGRTYANNVHQCSSATCDICMAKQHRPTFVPTGEAPALPPRMPTDARRHYVADDTVSL